MIVLGIDTSCDDTSGALVEDGCRLISNVVHSQVALHHPYGGVVPELASREHVRNIMPVVQRALSSAGMDLPELDGIAVTTGPGLVGSLLVGLYYAKALAFACDIPLVAVNHLEGHILSVFLEKEAPDFPYLALTVSGGHSSLFRVRGFGRYDLLGQTLDDAAGEAFDKVAKLLGLGYPGGPVIEEMSKEGGKDRIRFPRAYLSSDSLDFSFSGLKTAVALYLKKWAREEQRTGVTKADIAASFQESVVDVLVDRVVKASRQTGITSVALAGGVACNGRLREQLGRVAHHHRLRLFFPRPELCTDNGAMIAVAGYHRLLSGQRADWLVDVQSRFSIRDLSSPGSRPSL